MQYLPFESGFFLHRHFRINPKTTTIQIVVLKYQQHKFPTIITRNSEATTAMAMMIPFFKSEKNQRPFACFRKRDIQNNELDVTDVSNVVFN